MDRTLWLRHSWQADPAHPSSRYFHDALCASRSLRPRTGSGADRQYSGFRPNGPVSELCRFNPEANVANLPELLQKF